MRFVAKFTCFARSATEPDMPEEPSMSSTPSLSHSPAELYRAWQDQLAFADLQQRGGVARA